MSTYSFREMDQLNGLIIMGALDMGLEENELKPLVDTWHQSNPNIVQLWWGVDKAVKEGVKNITTTSTHGIMFLYECGFLFITLPSGRRLAYVKPRMGSNVFGRDCVTYEGVEATKKWERIGTSGPKLVEKHMRNALFHYEVGSSFLKSELFHWLKQKPPEGDDSYPFGWCHFPQDRDDEYFKQLCAEVLQKTTPKDKRSKVKWE